MVFTSFWFWRFEFCEFIWWGLCCWWFEWCAFWWRWLYAILKYLREYQTFCSDNSMTKCYLLDWFSNRLWLNGAFPIEIANKRPVLESQIHASSLINIIYQRRLYWSILGLILHSISVLIHFKIVRDLALGPVRTNEGGSKAEFEQFIYHVTISFEEKFEWIKTETVCICDMVWYTSRDYFLQTLKLLNFKWIKNYTPA